MFGFLHIALLVMGHAFGVIDFVVSFGCDSFIPFEHLLQLTIGGCAGMHSTNSNLILAPLS